MARLTRTAKYADLREQMANDSEASLATEQLKPFEDKLKSVNPNYSSEISRNNVFENIVQPETTNKYSSYDSYVSFGKTTKNEEINNTQVKVNGYQDNLSYNNPFSSDAIKIDDQSIYDFISSLDKQNEIEPEEKVAETPIAEFEKTVEPKVEKEPEIINENHDDIDDIVKQLENDFVSLNGGLEQINEEPKTEPKVDINNDYLTQTLKEVNEHNKNDGLTIADEIPSSMVNAIRHPGEPINSKNSNDEFSNTVTLEIDKVLSEISAQQEFELARQEQIKAQNIEQSMKTPTSQIRVKEPAVTPVKVEEPVVVQQEAPILTKTVNEPVVEIKSMEETLTQEVLDDTIPFNVSNEEETIIEDYEEDEAPNKVLNVILIVLIVILLAILGVIVYYILFAKGIIG